MPALDSEALSDGAWRWFGGGLGAAFVITVALLLLMIMRSEKSSGIDQGFMGLIVLLTTIFYLVAFSFLVAASAKGWDIKVVVAVVDGLVLLGSKLLAPSFLRYLNEESIEPHQAAELGKRPSSKSAEASEVQDINVLMAGHQLQITADVDAAGLAKLKQLLDTYVEILKP